MGRRSVSVVMVTCFTGPVLFQAINSALLQDELDQLIIVNNGNHNATALSLASIAATDNRVVLLAGHGNVGYAAGANLGARAGTGDYVLFLNPDCILPTGALSRFRQIADNCARPFVLGPMLVNLDSSEQRGSRRAALTPRTAVVEALRLDRLAPSWLNLPRLNRIDEPIPDTPREIPAVSGACMFVPTDEFRTMGGFDERYFLHVDDMDYCLQVEKSGGKVIWIPNIMATHYGGTSGVNSLFVEWHKARSFAKYFNKNFGRSHHGLTIAALCLLGYLRFIGKAPALCLRSVSFRFHEARTQSLARLMQLQLPPRRDRSNAGNRVVLKPQRQLAGNEIAQSRLHR